MKSWRLWKCRHTTSQCVVGTDTWSAYHARSVAAQVLGAPIHELEVAEAVGIVSCDYVHYYGKTEHGTYERWVGVFPPTRLRKGKQK